MDQTISVIVECLENIGIIVDVDDVEDVDLRTYHLDSILFISFIVELENRLSLELPDEYLHIDSLSSLKGFANMLDTLILQK